MLGQFPQFGGVWGVPGKGGLWTEPDRPPLSLAPASGPSMTVKLEINFYCSSEQARSILGVEGPSEVDLPPKSVASGLSQSTQGEGLSSSLITAGTQTPRESSLPSAHFEAAGFSKPVPPMINARPELVELLRSFFYGQERFEERLSEFNILPGDEIAIKSMIEISFCKGKNKKLRKKLILALELDIKACLEEIRVNKLFETCRQKRSISGLLSLLPIVLRMINAPRLCHVVDGFSGTDRLSEAKIRETLMKPDIFPKVNHLVENPGKLKAFILNHFNEYFDKRISRWLADIAKSAELRLDRGWKTGWGEKMRMTLTPLDCDRVIENFMAIFVGKKFIREH